MSKMIKHVTGEAANSHNAILTVGYKLIDRDELLVPLARFVGRNVVEGGRKRRKSV